MGDQTLKKQTFISPHLERSLTSWFTAELPLPLFTQGWSTLTGRTPGMVWVEPVFHKSCRCFEPDSTSAPDDIFSFYASNIPVPTSSYGGFKTRRFFISLKRLWQRRPVCLASLFFPAHIFFQAWSSLAPWITRSLRLGQILIFIILISKCKQMWIWFFCLFCFSGWHTQRLGLFLGYSCCWPSPYPCVRSFNIWHITLNLNFKNC